MAGFVSEKDLKELKIFFVAGGGPDDNKIHGMNRCLVNVGGKPVLERMLDVFHDLDAKNIYIAGNADELSNALEPRGQEYIDCVGLLSTKVDRILREFSFSKEEPVLFMFSDTPLFNKDSLIYYLSKCDLDRGDIFVPLVPKEYIQLFSSYFDRNYFFTRDIDSRVNCMHLVKPARCDFRYIQNLRESRKIDSQDPDFGTKTQRKNFAANMFRAFGFGGLFFGIKALLNSRLYRTKYRNLHRFLKDVTTLNEIEKYASRVFSARAKSVIIPYAETTLDIDGTHDAGIFTQYLPELEDIVSREHQIIDYLNSRSNLIEQIATSSSIPDEQRMQMLYSEMDGNARTFLSALKEDYHSFRRLLQIYSKKGPKAEGLRRD